jgi:hypothetical protein
MRHCLQSHQPIIRAEENSERIVVKNIRALHTIDLPLDTLTEMILVSLVCNRLDCETRKVISNLSLINNQGLITFQGSVYCWIFAGKLTTTFTGAENYNIIPLIPQFAAVYLPRI